MTAEERKKKTSSKLEIMKKKMSAVGEKTVSTEAKFFLDVYARAPDGNIQYLHMFFFNKHWTVSRVLQMLLESEAVASVVGPDGSTPRLYDLNSGRGVGHEAILHRLGPAVESTSAVVIGRDGLTPADLGVEGEGADK